MQEEKRKEGRKKGGVGEMEEGRDIWREGRERKREGGRKRSVIPFGLFTLSLRLIHEHIEKKAWVLPSQCHQEVQTVQAPVSGTLIPAPTTTKSPVSLLSLLSQAF